MLAILVGTAVRGVWTSRTRWASGITFSAKTLREFAVVSFGVSVSAIMVLTVFQHPEWTPPKF